MDPYSRHNDRDNAYTSSYSHPDSSLTNKSPNRLDYSSTGHHDFTTKDYTQPHHLDNIYSSQRTNDTFGTTNIHNIGTSTLAGTQSPTHLSGVHKQVKSPELSTSVHYQNYTSAYQPVSHHHEERSLKSSRDDVKASLDSARKVRESALRLLNEGPSSATKESHLLQNTYGLSTGVPAYGTVSDAHITTPAIHHHVEETKLNYDIHGSNQDSHLKKSNYIHESTNYDHLSPEARRILGSPVLDNHTSHSHLSPERKHMMHHEASPNPYLSTLANTAQTTVDPIRNRDTYTHSRLSDVTPAPFNRDLLENINDYRMNDPVVSRRTIYTIENPGVAAKATVTQDNRNPRTPERGQKVRSPVRSPLDDLRHSLNNNSAKISKIIIETVDEGIEGEGTFHAVGDSLGNNRLDIIMEQNVPLGASPYKSPAQDRLTRRANEQESTFREPSTLKTDFDHLKRDVAAFGFGHTEPHHNYRLGESSDAVRYQTRSDRSETEHHNLHAFERPLSAHRSPEKRSEPLVHESHHHDHHDHHHHHDDHHHHHDEHHHHHHEEHHGQKEEETKHEHEHHHEHHHDVKVHKTKTPSHLLVKGVIGLLVIILSSVLYLELFTDIKYENYFTF